MTDFNSLIDSSLSLELQNIPDRLAFKIGEVAELLGVRQYVVRYWEQEFQLLRPRKSTAGQRIFTRKDVALLLLIRKLVHRDRYSIQGARAQLLAHRKELNSLLGVGSVQTSLQESESKMKQESQSVALQSLLRLREQLVVLKQQVHQLNSIFVATDKELS